MYDYNLYKLEEFNNIKSIEQKEEIIKKAKDIVEKHYILVDNLFTGDTVFKVGVGRTDMFSGDEEILRISLDRLKNDIAQDINHFYAGHGPNFDKDDVEYNIKRFLGEE